MQVSAGALLLVGSVMLALPPSVSARCSGSGATFRCDPIISDALRKRTTPGYTNPYSRSRGTFTYEGWTYRTGTGANLSRSTYSDSLGNTYRGQIETFPGGAYRHRGSWQ